MADNPLTKHELLVMPTGFESRPDAATRYRLMNHHREHEFPAIVRLTRLVEENLRAVGVDVPYH